MHWGLLNSLAFELMGSTDMQASRNFRFLAVHDRELVILGTFAERYYADDPNTCSIKLRQYAELLAQLTAASYDL